MTKFKVIPAGHHKVSELLDCKYWFPTLWFACLHTIQSKEGKAKYAATYEDRLQPDQDAIQDTTKIVLSDHFLPEDLIALQKKYQTHGGLIGLIGLLGGPLEQLL